jgi:hypothetical protein
MGREPRLARRGGSIGAFHRYRGIGSEQNGIASINHFLPVTAWLAFDFGYWQTL